MLRSIGLMSGTSLDGVDAAWVETDGERVAAFGPALTLPYDDRLRADLRALLDRAGGINGPDAALDDVVRRLTDRHAEAVAAIGRPADLIGMHGQTILHRPILHRPILHRPAQHGRTGGRTWQIGDAQALADRTGVPVAHDFRSADVAAGGQGAPLIPVFHAVLAAGMEPPVAFLNIGGVANVTYVGGNGDLLAFDTGPGNGPLDDLASRQPGLSCDRDGVLSAAGQVHAAVLERLLADPYFARKPPKSLDRLDFAASLAASGIDDLTPADGAATLVAFTAQAVAAGALPATPRRWLVHGGGRHNPSIMQALRQALDVPVEPVEAMGWDGDALEAQCFALLAVRVARGLPLSFPGTTGVPFPLAGGAVAVPR